VAQAAQVGNLGGVGVLGQVQKPGKQDLGFLVGEALRQGLVFQEKVGGVFLIASSVSPLAHKAKPPGQGLQVLGVFGGGHQGLKAGYSGPLLLKLGLEAGPLLGQLLGRTPS
jgi:hypothetical protein